MDNKNDQILDDFDLERDLNINTTRLSTIGKWVGISSFLIGTALLIPALIHGYIDELFVVGFLFTLLAFLINLILFIVLLFAGKSSVEKSINRKMALKMLINIPIVIVYFFFIDLLTSPTF